MATSLGTITANERSKRSIFVGNIPYEASEEQLKGIFSRVGPILNFQLMYDRETGNSRGFGFCEYRDNNAALSAMRNFNGFELHGHVLKVGSAASENIKEELRNLQASMGRPPTESAKPPEVDAEKAPEEISKAVASLPPEEMFELMKQMKLCVQNNPNEARNLLLQNPQLAYALLQAQVLMKIVDPHVAMSILNRPLAAVPPADTGSNQPPTAGTSKMPGHGMPTTSTYSHPMMVPPGVKATNVMSSAAHVASSMGFHMNPAMGNPHMSMPSSSVMGDHPSMVQSNMFPGLINQFSERGRHVMDPRAMGDCDMRQHVADQDMRMSMADKGMHQMGDQDFRNITRPPLPDNRPIDPRFKSRQGGHPGQIPGGFDSQRPAGPYDPRTYDGRSQGQPKRLEDPRNSQFGARAGRSGTGPQAPPGAEALSQMPSAPPDMEKAALIMQVLQLTDQQIAMLPHEQQESIMMLKEQIARQSL